MKRMLSILMMLVMVLGFSPAGVWADDEQTWEWQLETPMPETIGNSRIISVGSKIYVFGGKNYAQKEIVYSLYIYDTDTKEWTHGGFMPDERTLFGLSAVGNKIYVLGGKISGQVSDSPILIYDTALKTWSTSTNMIRASYVYAAAIDGKIYLCEGSTSSAFAMVYDTKTDSLSEWDAGIAGTREIQAVGDNLYLLQSSSSIGAWVLNVCNVQKKTIHSLTSVPSGSSYTGFHVIENKIYLTVVGNYQKKFSIPVYDIETDRWAVCPQALSSVQAASSVVVDHTLYMIGGADLINGETVYLDTVQSLRLGPSKVDPTDPEPLEKNVLAVLLDIAETVQLSVTHNLAHNTDLTWTSTEDPVATVDANGKVTAHAEGLTYIYAENEDGSFKEYIPVRVIRGADEMRLAVHLNAGQKAKLHLTDDPAQVTWSSLDESVAAVSDVGVVTGISRGLAIVQAEVEGEIHQIYVRVNS